MHSIIETATGKRINPSKDIVVADHVWLGRGVTVLKGSSIGANTIVGANSMVTGEVPANCLAVGTPAKVIKEGVSWDRRRLKV